MAAHSEKVTQLINYQLVRNNCFAARELSSGQLV